MSGIVLFVFVSSTIRSVCSEVMKSTVATSLLSSATKGIALDSRSDGGLNLTLLSPLSGAVGISFFVRDVSLGFVNCHLSAQQDQVKNRNNDISEIIQSTKDETGRVQFQWRLKL